MASAPCPSCGSADVRRADDGKHRCNVCDAAFLVDASGKVTTLTAGRPVKTASSPVWRYVGALVAAVAIGGAWWLANPPGEAGPTVGGEPVLSVNIPEKKRGASLKIEDVREGRTADDRPFWIMTVRNDGSRPLRNPSVVVQLYDNRGTPAGTVEAHALVDVLEPGAESALLALDDRPAHHARSEVDAAPLDPAPKRATMTALMVRTTGVTPNGNSTDISGEVVNTLDQDMALSDIVVVGRTMQGKPVAWARSQAAVDVISPGQTVKFDLRVGEIQVEAPAAWTAYAMAKAVLPAAE